MTFTVRTLITTLLLIAGSAHVTKADDTEPRHLILVTIDGLRGEELFGGADVRLLNKVDGGVRDIEAIQKQFGAATPEARRKRLMPFLWSTIGAKGQIIGDRKRGSVMRVTNGRYFSYPGYNELLSGFADPRIDSNDKRHNRNVTVLEWLHRKPGYQGRVAAFCSWDVFPYILNEPRSGIPVNAGWEKLEVFASESSRQDWNRLSAELPRYWHNVRYDAFTFRGAVEYLRVKRPRVLYVALGETDDWAHDGRYDLYLDAARRSDDYIRRLWEAVQSLDEYRGRTSLLVTTDHGRGGGRTGWKSHGVSHSGSEFIWMAVIGPDTPADGVRAEMKAEQAQVAATAAALLGENFAASSDRVRPRVPGVVRGD